MAQYDGSIRINTKIDNKNASAQLMYLENRIVKTSDKIASLRSKMDSLKNVKIPTKEFEVLSDSLKKAESNYARLKSESEKPIKHSDEYKLLAKDLEKAEKELQKLASEQEMLEKIGLPFDKSFNEEVARAADKVDLIKEKMNSIEVSEKAFKLEKLQESSDEIEKIKAQMQQISGSEKAFTFGQNTEEYAKMNQQLQYLESDYAVLVQRKNEFDQKNAAKPDGYERLRNSLSELKNSFNNAAHPIESMKASFLSAAEIMKEKAAGVAATIVNGIAHPIQSIGKIAKSSISVASGMLSNLGSVAKKVGSSIAGIAAKFLHMGKKAKSASRGISSMGSGFKNLVKNALGISSIYMLFSKLNTAVKDGFKNMAQVSEPVNKSISSLKSALTQLKNSLATAFAPVLTAVSPALTTLINMASKAATAVGMLIAALTGQKTFTKATAVQEDYAASLKKTSSEAKKTNKQLSSLDKLNNLTTQDKDGGDKGNGGISPSDMFETVDIAPKIGDFAKKLKDAWKKADFTEIGEIIGTKLKNALDNIPWDKIKASAAKIGKSLGTLINGFVEVPGLGNTIGRTIAEGINTGLILLKKLGKSIHFDSVGKFIADGINGILEASDSKLLATTFNIWAKGILDAMIKAVQNVKWNLLSSKIVELINNIDAKGISWKLGKLVNSLANAFYQLVSKKSTWTALGTKIADGINGFFKGMNDVDPKTGLTGFQALGKNISKSISGIAGTITTALEGVEWKSVGQSIGNFISSIDFSNIAWNLAKMAASLFSAITDAIRGFVDKAPIESAIIALFAGLKLTGLGSTIATAISASLAGKSLALGKIAIGLGLGAVTIKLANEGKLKSSILASITAFMATASFTGNINLSLKVAAVTLAAAGGFKLGKVIGEWINKQLASEDMSQYRYDFKFTDLFSYKPSEWLQGIADMLVDTGIADIPSKIKKFFSDAWNKVKEVWNGATKFFSNIWSGIKNTFNSVGSWFKTKFTTAWTNVKGAWNGAKKFFSGVWKNIKGAFGDIADWFEKKFSKAWEVVKNVFSKGGKIFDGIKDGILNGLKSVINALINGINKVVKIPFDGLNKALGKLKNVKIAGKAPFDFLPTIDVPQIPRLATGAVIPPNKEFLAVLGDQKSGTNIEAPLSTIEKAVTNAMIKNGGIGNGNGNITLNIKVDLDGREVFRSVQKYDREQVNSTGRPSFII